MRAVLLDATPPGDEACRQGCDALRRALSDAGHALEVYPLAELSMAACTGCFGCWTRTPGRCVIVDASEIAARAIMAADLAAVYTPVSFGAWHSGAKRLLDRLICLVSPHFEAKGGLTRHKARYGRHPAMLAVGWLPGADGRPGAVPDEEARLFASLAEHNAYNLRARAFAVVDLRAGSPWADMRQACAAALARLTGPGAPVPSPPPGRKPGAGPLPAPPRAWNTDRASSPPRRDPAGVAPEPGPAVEGPAQGRAQRPGDPEPSSPQSDPTGVWSGERFVFDPVETPHGSAQASQAPRAPLPGRQDQAGLTDPAPRRGDGAAALVARPPAPKVLLLLGSPRKAGVSGALGSFLLEALAARGWQAEIIRLKGFLDSQEERARLLAAFLGADLTVLAAPVYVDAPPAPVMRALEFLAGADPSPARPRRLTAVFNCGFPESSHTDICLEVCRLFARRAGLDWAGGLGLGGGGAIEGASLKSRAGLTAGLRQALTRAAQALAGGEDIPEAVRLAVSRPLIPWRLYRFLAEVNWLSQAVRRRTLFRLGHRPFRTP